MFVHSFHHHLVPEVRATKAELSRAVTKSNQMHTTFFSRSETALS